MRRIKKGIAVALSLVLALSLTACGTKKSAEKNDKLVMEHQLQLTELCQRHRIRFVQVWQQFLAESRLMTVALRL